MEQALDFFDQLEEAEPSPTPDEHSQNDRSENEVDKLDGDDESVNSQRSNVWNFFNNAIDAAGQIHAHCTIGHCTR